VCCLGRSETARRGSRGRTSVSLEQWRPSISRGKRDLLLCVRRGALAPTSPSCAKRRRRATRMRGSRHMYEGALRGSARGPGPWSRLSDTARAMSQENVDRLRQGRPSKPPGCRSKRLPGGVSDGIRTRDRLDHNQELYRLSYAHQDGPLARRPTNLAAADPATRAITARRRPGLRMAGCRAWRRRRPDRRRPRRPAPPPRSSACARRPCPG
jgi:hypothetical protein